jgi:hypothetical protein
MASTRGTCHEREILLRLQVAVAARERHTDERARGVERPAVVRQRNVVALPARERAHEVRAVGAAVQQEMDLAAPVARHEDGLRADRLLHEVAGRRDLAHVPDVDPGPVPDALELGGEDRRVGVERAVDAVGTDQRVEVGDRRGRTHGSFLT